MKIINNILEMLYRKAQLTSNEPASVSTQEFWLTFFNTRPEDLTPEDAHRAYTMANSWNTCACGSLNDGLPRTASDAPDDAQLRMMGNDFPNIIQQLRHAISDPSRDTRKAFYDCLNKWMAIERRAGVVLRDIGRTRHQLVKVYPHDKVS